MKRRFCSILLSAMLAVPAAVPQTVLPVFAETETEATAPIFTHEDLVTVTNGNGAIVADETDVTKFANLESFTFETKFTVTSTSGVHTLFFVGDKNQNSHYSSVYVFGTKLGIESLAGGGNPYKTSVDLSGADWTKEHSLVVVFTAKSKVTFYLDGEKVHEANVTVNAVKDVLSNVNYAGFGLGSRSGGGNNYPMSGTLRSIKIFDRAKTETEVNQDYYGNLSTVVLEGLGTTLTTSTSDIDKIKNMTEGTWSARFRLDGTSTGCQYVSALSDNTQAGMFAALYVMKKDEIWKIGVDNPGGVIGAAVELPSGTELTPEVWHDLTAVRAGKTWTFYLDGQIIGSKDSSGEGMFSAISNANSLSSGYADRGAGGNPNPIAGSVERVTVYSAGLTPEQAAIAARPIESSGQQKVDMTNAYFKEADHLFYNGYDTSAAYRIPSMITTKDGTVLVGIDKRQDGSGDCGNIDLVVRRREAGSDSFGEPIVISDLLKSTNSGKSALMIDSSLLQDTDPDSPHYGWIFALVDMFTESNAAIGDYENLDYGDQYLKIGDKAYREIYDDDNVKYAIAEEDGIGVVYKVATENGAEVLGEKTDYTVTLHCPAPYQQMGNLYKAGEYKGNIFMNENGADKGELHMKKAMFLWLFYSDDDGKTWSEPTDITPSIKQDWMKFCGTGPGRGLQLANGRLCYPVYTSGSDLSHQASALIVSDDYGETWSLKDSPVTVNEADRSGSDAFTQYTESQAVQLKNGKVLLFMRSYAGNVQYAVSSDNGNTWESIHSTGLYDPYCQLSVITYTGKDGGEYILMSNPGGPLRNNGTLNRGKVNEDGSITWDHQKMFAPGAFAYNCLTELAPAEDGTKRFADFYEGIDLTQEYVEFDENYLAAKMVAVETTSPKAESVNAEQTENGIKVTVAFDQTVFAPEAKLSIAAGETGFDLPVTSGSATDTLTFEGSVPPDFKGKLVLKGIAQSSGEITNRNGISAVLDEQDLIDLSEVRPVAIKDFSSQHSASTEENRDGAAVNAIDGNPNTYWQSNYTGEHNLPQYLTVDLGEVMSVNKMNILNRQSNNNTYPKDYTLEASVDGETFTTVMDSTLENQKSRQTVSFKPTEARYMRFTVKSGYVLQDFTCVAEISFNKTIEDMIVKPDTSVLKAQIEELSKLEEKSTSATWTVFKAVLDKASALAENEYASQAAVHSMVEKLTREARALADKRDLVELSTRLSALDRFEYTPKSWAPMGKALELKPEDMTSQREVENQLMKLRYLETSLVKDTIDRRLFVEACEYYEGRSLSEAEFDEAAFAKTKDAYDSVKDLLTDDNATQEAVDAASLKLNQALLELRFTPSAEKLEKDI